MAKKRKTRKQKLTADLRYQGNAMITHDQPPEKKEMPKPFTYISSAQVSSPTNTTILTQDYQYVTRDLLKTAFVTGIIVTSELILSFTVKGF